MHSCYTLIHTYIHINSYSYSYLCSYFYICRPFNICLKPIKLWIYYWISTDAVINYIYTFSQFFFLYFYSILFYSITICYEIFPYILWQTFMHTISKKCSYFNWSTQVDEMMDYCLQRHMEGSVCCMMVTRECGALINFSCIGFCLPLFL